jgi:hypothetical protein
LEGQKKEKGPALTSPQKQIQLLNFSHTWVIW